MAAQAPAPAGDRTPIDLEALPEWDTTAAGAAFVSDGFFQAFSIKEKLLGVEDLSYDVKFSLLDMAAMRDGLTREGMANPHTARENGHVLPVKKRHHAQMFEDPDESHCIFVETLAAYRFGAEPLVAIRYVYGTSTEPETIPLLMRAVQEGQRRSPNGVGKTRVSVEAIKRLLEIFDENAARLTERSKRALLNVPGASGLWKPTVVMPVDEPYP